MAADVTWRKRPLPHPPIPNPSVAEIPPAMPDLSGAAGSSGTGTSAWATADSLDDQLKEWRHSRLLEYSKELGLIER